MKKLLIITIAIIGIGLLFTQISSAFVTIRDVRGGSKGADGKVYYDRVYTEDGMFTDKIVCSGAGINYCPKKLSVQQDPSKEDDFEAAMDYAFDQISTGNFSGQSNLATGLTVKWSAEDTDAATSLVKVWATGDPEPEYNSVLDN